MVCFILTSKTIVVQKLPVADLEKNIDALRENITTRNLPEFNQYSRTLYVRYLLWQILQLKQKN